MDSETLSARLQERLKATRQQPIPLAVKLGRGRDFLTDVLNGKKKSIPNDVLTPLARALRCDERYFTDDLFTNPGRPRRPVSAEQLAEHRRAAEQSGVFLRAWREFENLSPQDLADETKFSLAMLSDIETGILSPDELQVAVLATALNTTPGFLRLQNPFETERRVAHLVSITEGLDLRDQQALLDLAETLSRRATA